MNDPSLTFGNAIQQPQDVNMKTEEGKQAKKRDRSFVTYKSGDALAQEEMNFATDTYTKEKKIRAITASPQPIMPAKPISLYDSSSVGLFSIFFKIITHAESKAPSLLEVSRWLSKANIKFERLDKVTRYQWEATFNSRSEANKSITNKYLPELKLEAFIPRHKLYRKGVINGVPLDVPLEEFSDAILNENVNVKINSLFRLRRRNRTTKEMEDSASVVIEFKGQCLPDTLIIWRSVIRVTPYVQAVRLCFKCGLIGHLSKFCNRNQCCLTCANHHPRDPQCALPPKCINCDGSHRTLDRSCPAYVKRNDIAKIMARNNLSYLEAARIYEGKDAAAYKNIAPPAFNSTNFPELPQRDLDIAKLLSGNMKQILEAILNSPQTDLLAERIWHTINLHRERQRPPPSDHYGKPNKKTYLPVLKNSPVELQKP